MMRQAFGKMKYSVQRMFQTSSTATILLHYVEEADYAAVKKIIQTNPLLMFEETLIKGTHETISPLVH